MLFIKKLLYILLIFPIVTHASPPDWVTNLGKSNSHPDFVYLTGFGMTKISDDSELAEGLELARAHARGNLIQKLRVNIRTTIKTHMEEADRNISEYFSTATESHSSLEVEGLEVVTHFDRRERVCYGFAYVNREQLINSYREKIRNIQQQIREHFEAGRRYEETGQPTRALEEYLRCRPLMGELVEKQAVISAAHSSMTRAYEELESINDMDFDGAKIQKAIDGIIQRPIESPGDLAWYLAYSLNQQYSPNHGVMVTPFSFQDTRMGSSFSRYFKQLFESTVMDVAGWDIKTQLTDFHSEGSDVAREYLQSSGAGYILLGSYWEHGDNVKFITTLRRVDDYQIVASSEANVDTDIIASTNLSLKPQNYVEALRDQEIFGRNEVVGGGLNLEVWTNKGSDNLIYTDGEIMEVYVRVNMPAYIRFIYHLVDGKRTLLMDSYYIDESNVNKAYKIPYRFQCVPPFGAEVLQVFVQNVSFEPLDTVEQDGFHYLREDLEEVLAKTRGFVLVRDEVLQTEHRITITTLPDTD